MKYVTVFTNVATTSVRDGANESSKQTKQELKTGIYDHKSTNTHKKD